jgi:prophage maintenance system killer protein
MAIDLLISIARGHHLPNGNKRMAVLMLTTFLDYFGIYIFQSYSKKDRIKYVKTWELIMCEIVDKRRYIQNKLGELVPTTEILTDKEIITNIL